MVPARRTNPVIDNLKMRIGSAVGAVPRRSRHWHISSEIYVRWRTYARQSAVVFVVARAPSGMSLSVPPICNRRFIYLARRQHIGLPSLFNHGSNCTFCQPTFWPQKVPVVQRLTVTSPHGIVHPNESIHRTHKFQRTLATSAPQRGLFPR